MCSKVKFIVTTQKLLLFKMDAKRKISNEVKSQIRPKKKKYWNLRR